MRKAVPAQKNARFMPRGSAVPLRGCFLGSFQMCHRLADTLHQNHLNGRNQRLDFFQELWFPEAQEPAEAALLFRLRILPEKCAAGALGRSEIHKSEKTIIRHPPDQGKGILKILKRFSGKAHDDIRCNGDIRTGIPKPGNFIQIHIPGVLRVHAGQDSGRSGLNRKVDMLA